MPLTELIALVILAVLIGMVVRDMLRVSYELWTAARIRRDDRLERDARWERQQRIMSAERERNLPPAPKPWGTK